MADTYLRRSLDSANDKAKYDENVKAILSDKTTPEKKEEILEHTYRIPMSYELKKEAAEYDERKILYEVVCGTEFAGEYERIRGRLCAAVAGRGASGKSEP